MQLAYSLSFLCIIACTRSSKHRPTFETHTQYELSPKISIIPDSTWALENIQPDANIILIDGRETPFSIEIKVSGDANYALAFSSDRKKLRPFLIRTIQGQGEIEVYGTAKWYVRVSGKSETVTFSLYKIDKSSIGKTKVMETKTLVKQIKRTYCLVCDKKEHAVILFFKKILGACEPELQSDSAIK